MPVRAMIKHFRAEFVHHIEHKTCLVGAAPAAAPIPAFPQRGKEQTEALRA